MNLSHLINIQQTVARVRVLSTKLQMAQRPFS